MSVRKPIAAILVAESTVIVISSGIIMYLVTATSPKQLGPVGVTIWFLAFFVSVLSLVSLIDFIWRLRKTSQRDRAIHHWKESLRFGLLVSFCVSVLLGLLSLRSLTIRDMILFILTVVLIELYFRTRKSEV
jgi:glycopeptide antibiotics resistance protein